MSKSSVLGKLQRSSSIRDQAETKANLFDTSFFQKENEEYKVKNAQLCTFRAGTTFINEINKRKIVQELLSRSAISRNKHGVGVDSKVLKVDRIKYNFGKRKGNPEQRIFCITQQSVAFRG